MESEQKPPSDRNRFLFMPIWGAIFTVTLLIFVGLMAFLGDMVLGRQPHTVAVVVVFATIFVVGGLGAAVVATACPNLLGFTPGALARTTPNLVQHQALSPKTAGNLATLGHHMVSAAEVLIGATSPSEARLALKAAAEIIDREGGFDDFAANLRQAAAMAPDHELLGLCSQTAAELVSSSKVLSGALQK